MKPPLAILTMIRGDFHWAKPWRDHYSQQVESLSDLYAIINGADRIVSLD